MSDWLLKMMDAAADHWFRRLVYHVDRRFRVEEAIIQTASELHLILKNESMSAAWRTEEWLREKLTLVRFPNITIIPLTEFGEFVVPGRSRTEAITLYGLDPDIDEAFDRWEPNWYTDGPRGGVVRYHNKAEQSRKKKDIANSMRGSGISESAIRAFILDVVV